MECKSVAKPLKIAKNFKATRLKALITQKLTFIEIQCDRNDL
jgi:hypothetical protein